MQMANLIDNGFVDLRGIRLKAVVAHDVKSKFKLVLPHEFVEEIKNGLSSLGLTTTAEAIVAGSGVPRRRGSFAFPGSDSSERCLDGTKQKPHAHSRVVRHRKT